MSKYTLTRWITFGFLLLMAVVLTGIILLIDVNVPSEVAIPAMYCIVILYSWLLPGRWSSVQAATICSLLVLVGYFFGDQPEIINHDLNDHYPKLNRLISIVVIWVCASLVTIAKRTLHGLEQAQATLEQQVEERTEELQKKVEELNYQQTLLQKSELQFRNLMNSAPDAIIIVNEDGLIKLTNNQASVLFGYEQHEMIGKGMEILIPQRFRAHHPKLRHEYYNKPAVRPMGANLDLWAINNKGHEFPVEVSLSPFETDEGVWVIAAVRDITERKQAERLKLHAQETKAKNKELEQFVYVASHDLQEPLRTILSFTELLEKQFKDKLDNNSQQYLTYIQEASTRMSQLIKDLLEYSRIGINKDRTTVNCNALMEELQKDLAFRISETNATFEIGNLPSVKGYQTELRLLFQNLLSNALKFRHKDRSPVIKISAEKKKEFWLFSFTDNGIGMEAKHKEKIFVAFQRLHSAKAYEGTGIGLAHCQKIVNLHGGRIWVDPMPDVGCTFHFTIPI